MEIINRCAVNGCMPDITFLMKVRPDVSSSRMKDRELDRIEMENMEFYKRVSEGYDKLEKEFPERIIGIDADGTIEDIERVILVHMENLMNTGQREAGTD